MFGFLDLKVLKSNTFFVKMIKKKKNRTVVLCAVMKVSIKVRFYFFSSLIRADLPFLPRR